MSQQINLLVPEVAPKANPLRFSVLPQVVAVTLAVVLSVYYYMHKQITGLEQEVKSAQTLAAAQKAYSDRLKKSADPKSDSALTAEIARLEEELRTAKETMSSLDGGALGNHQGYSEYMRAFSRQSISGLWLTGFTVSSGGDVQIQGRTTQAELVATYIQRLGQESVLKGRNFAALEMQQARPSRPGTETAPPAKGRVPTLQRYIEFTLSTSEERPQTAQAQTTESVQ